MRYLLEKWQSGRILHSLQDVLSLSCLQDRQVEKPGDRRGARIDLRSPFLCRHTHLFSEYGKLVPNTGPVTCSLASDALPPFFLSNSTQASGLGLKASSSGSPSCTLFLSDLTCPSERLRQLKCCSGQSFIQRLFPTRPPALYSTSSLSAAEQTR